MLPILKEYTRDVNAGILSASWDSVGNIKLYFIYYTAASSACIYLFCLI